LRRTQYVAPSPIVEGGEVLMVLLFVRHSVDDYDAWRKTYDEFDRQRGPMGVTGDAVFRRSMIRTSHRVA
jgi:hypothetical protein